MCVWAAASSSTAFSLTLDPGEIVCLLGESGSGKSTALRVAAGIQPIHGGSVRINDEIVSAPGRHLPPDRRGIGLMFQDFALFPHLTRACRTCFSASSASAAMPPSRQARAALRRVGLADREADYPHMLSGGQQQRLALARSVAPRPGILLLDEPFSSLDARMRETVRDETLAVLRETNATSLIVTHDPEEAMVLGDRVALLRHGRIAQIGTAAEIYREPVDLSAARFFSPLCEIAAVVAAGRRRPPRGRSRRPALPMAPGSPLPSVRPAAPKSEPRARACRAASSAKRDAIGIDICEVKVEGIETPDWDAPALQAPLWRSDKMFS